MAIVIGIDSGTTVTKAVAADDRAEMYAAGDAGYELRLPKAHRAELDPADLQRAAVRALTDVAEKLDQQGRRPDAVCVSAAMHGLLPFDHANRPLGPVATWADTRADEQARWLRRQPQGRELHRRTGTPVHPMSPLTKLMWTSAHHRDLHRSTVKWGGVKELILATLVDAEFTIDLSCASATGMYDIVERRWDPEALTLAEVDETQLARVVPTTAIVGPLRPEIARETGLPEGTPVIAGASDGTLANLGVGAVVPGCAALSVGTSGALRAVRQTPAIDENGRLFCYALTGDHWVLGGAVSNGASVLDWAAAALGTPEDPHGHALLEEADKVPPGSEGLLVLPYLLGERAPWWRSGLHGAVIGLRRDHGRGHLVRAAVEGVAQQLALIRQALADAGVEIHEVRATGGALSSKVWTNVLAAALNLPLRHARSTEDTAVGAALLGHHALGALPDLDQVADLIPLGAETAPEHHPAEVYRAMRPLVELAVAGLEDTFAALDALPPSRGGAS